MHHSNATRHVHLQPENYWISDGRIRIVLQSGHGSDSAQGAVSNPVSDSRSDGSTGHRDSRCASRRAERSGSGHGRVQVFDEDGPDIADVNHSPMWSYPCLQKLRIDNLGGLGIPLRAFAKLSLFIVVNQISKEDQSFALAIASLVDAHPQSVDGYLEWLFFLTVQLVIS